jgi:hypothetical protein
MREAVGPAFDARERLFEACGSGEVDGEVAIGEAFEVDVRVDQAGSGAACEADDFCAASRCCAGCIPDCQDPAVDARGDLRVTSREERGPDHKP